MANIKDLIEECEALVREGHPQRLARRLQKLQPARVPRPLRLKLANLARRAGLTSVGLKILTPLMAAPHSTADSKLALRIATPAERTEYAALLLRAGASVEALRILKELGAEAPLEADWLRASAALEQLDFDAARAPLLRFVLASQSGTARTQAQLRLAQVFLMQKRAADAQKLLQQISEDLLHGESHSPGFVTKAQVNVHALRAQIYLSERDFRAARAELEAGQSLGLPGAHALRKHQAILSALESRATEPLRAYRQEALSRRESEHVREVDFVSLLIDFQPADFDYLIFGTPHAAFRERAYRELGQRPRATDYVLGSEQAACFDVQTGEVGGSTLTTPGRQIHQALEILLRDFYQPVKIGTLFAELFPEEPFLIHVSPHRVHQVLLRARAWLKESGIPAEISSEGGVYSVKLSGAFGFRVPLERRSVERYAVFVDALRGSFKDAWGFSSREARGLLGLSSTGFKRFASWAVENGHLERHGASSATFYKLAPVAPATRRVA